MDHVELKSQNFEYSNDLSSTKDLKLKSEGSSNCFIITSRSAGDYSSRLNNERMSNSLQLSHNSSSRQLKAIDNLNLDVRSLEFYKDPMKTEEILPTETYLGQFSEPSDDDDEEEEEMLKIEGIDLNKRRRMSCRLRSELLKYKEELKQYKDTTQELESKYKKINNELSEMQEKHQRFMEQRHKEQELGGEDINSAEESYSYSSTDSDISLQRKSTQIFHRGSSFMQVVPHERYTDPAINFEGNLGSYDSFERRSGKNNTRGARQGKEIQPPLRGHTRRREEGFSQMVSRNKNYLPAAPDPAEVILQNTIDSLQTEQQQFRSIIEQQQHCLQDYHSRCMRAQRVMKTQQIQIEKLNTNNRHLEAEISHGFEQLRNKIETKLRELSQLPQQMKEEKLKNERMSRDNVLLNDRLRSIQIEATQMKKKIEEISKRKLATMARLKTAERDLKIFRNYNTALKHEKRKLSEELMKVRDQMQAMENGNKRTQTRQREQSEKQKRDLQKRIFELEHKLSRSQTSASSLVQERDALIAELQTQLNNLVHNFEISQKHIRILRRHIYNMTGSNSRDAVARNRILVETS
ncbi:uncharacterized protein [Musca autumnalis]|uniref:uncharacterized protein n=1 Tax=Musca autumnalis TaxID=221902 RepID=UPI003CE8CF72